MFELAEKIAKFLPGEWQAHRAPEDYANHEDWCWVVRADGLRFVIEKGRRFGRAPEGRISVRISYPTDHRGIVVTPRDLLNPPEEPDITVSASKTAEQIARDIEKRFLAKADAMWTALQAVIASRKNQSETLTDERKKFGSLVEWLKDSERSGRFRGALTNNAYGDIEVYGDGRVHLNLRDVPTDEAVKILRALRRGA